MDNPPPPPADDCMKLSSFNMDDQPEDDDSPYLSDESRFSYELPGMTDEQSLEYYTAVIESEGFDVPAFPGTEALGRIEPMYNLKIRMAEVKEVADLAIEQYNKQNNTTFEILEFIKVNLQVVEGLLYFMTFKAKPIGTRADFHTTTFQAKVLHGVSCVEVQLSRVKAN